MVRELSYIYDGDTHMKCHLLWPSARLRKSAKRADIPETLQNFRRILEQNLRHVSHLDAERISFEF